ncbi:MAG: M56 family metallopeptidase [Thermoanaerobaculia bacterium]|nr:M56 family metallopeptidase [Thermoanaerobaculia bacterium]
MDSFVLEFLLPGALRAALGLALAVAAVRLARRASATTRHRLWSLGLLAALVLPVLGPLTPALARLPVPGAVVRATAPPLAAPVFIAPPPVVLPVEVAPVAVVPQPPAAVSLSPAAVVAGLWLLGVLVVLAGRGRGLVVRGFLRRQARPLADTAWSELVAELGRELGLRRPVTLLESPIASVPMTWGTWRPVVLLPAAARHWPADQRRAVLLHELAHVRRNDAALSALAHLACALHWPNPLVWLAARRQRAEAEHAADDRVLLRGLRPSLYAGHLLAVARAMAQGPPPPRPVLAMASPEGRSGLARRIGAILDGDRPRLEARRGFRLATGVLALLFTLGLAATGCVRMDDLSYSLTSSDSDGTGQPRGYFAQERFQGQCAADLLGGKGQSLRVKGHASGRHEIDLRQASCRLEIDVEGPLVVAAAGQVELGPGARLMVRETSGRGERSLLAGGGHGAGPVSKYRVDGADRPFDDEARAFVARALLEVQRSTTMGLEERVAALHSAGGSAAVLAEIAEISTDFLRAEYLKELFAQAHPRGAELTAALVVVAELIESDYEQSQILQSVAMNAEGGEPLPDAFFLAAGRIESDYERSQTLHKVLARSSVTEPEIVRVLALARELESDYERGQVLGEALNRSALPEATVLEVLGSIEGLESDYEASQVLGRLITKRPLAPAEIDGAIVATNRLESDYERAEILIALARANALGGPQLDHYVAAAEALDSEHDRDRALAAALRNRS